MPAVLGWHTLPRNLLQTQFDSLGLERTYETGIEDTADHVEKLTDYADLEEDARCPTSCGPVTDADQILRWTKHAPVVRCHVCGRQTYTVWKKTFNGWGINTHYPTHDPSQ